MDHCDIRGFLGLDVFGGLVTSGEIELCDESRGDVPMVAVVLRLSQPVTGVAAGKGSNMGVAIHPNVIGSVASGTWC